MALNNFRTCLFLACAVCSLVASAFKPYSYPYRDRFSGKWGFINQGNETVLAQYDDVAAIKKNLPYFWAKKNGKWGMCTSDNSVVIPFEYEDVCVNPMPLQIADSVRIVKPAKSVADNITKPAIDEKVSYRHFSFNRNTLPLFPVKKDGKWGYISPNGEVILPFIYDNAYTFARYLDSDSKRACWLAGVEFEGKKVYIDMIGNLMGAGDEVHAALAAQNGSELRRIDEKNAKKYIKKHSNTALQQYNTRYKTLCDIFDAVPLTTEYVNTYDGPFTIEEMKAPQVAAKKNVRRGKRTSANTRTTPQKKYFRIVYGREPVSIDSVEKVFDREGDAVRFIRKGRYNILNLANGFKFSADSIGQVDTHGNARYFFMEADSVSQEGKVNIRRVLTNKRNFIGEIYEEVDNASKTDNKYRMEAWLSALIDQFSSVYNHQLYAYSNDIDRFINSYEQPVVAASETSASKPKEGFWDKTSRFFDKINNGLNKLADAVSSSETLDAVGNTLDTLSAAIPAESQQQSADVESADSYEIEEYDSDASDGSGQSQTRKTKKKVEKKKSIPAAVWRAYETELNSIGRQLSDYKNKKSNQGLSSSDISRINSLKKRARAIRKECRDKYGETLPTNSMESWNP